MFKQRCDIDRFAHKCVTNIAVRTTGLHGYGSVIKKHEAHKFSFTTI